MNKSGIVLSIKRNNACIMTQSGEFAKVKVKGSAPSIGEEYTGSIVPKLDIIKYTSIAASLLLVLFSSGAAYAYYTPVSSVVLDINPSVKVEANRWNRIIKSEALNEDGKKVLENVAIKNKPLDEGLSMVFEEAKKENFLTNYNIDNGNEVKLTISSKKDVPMDLSEFKKSVDNANVELNITKNGKDLPPAAEIKKDNQENPNAGPKDKDDKTKTNNSNTPKVNDKNTNSSQPSVKPSDNESNKGNLDKDKKSNENKDNKESKDNNGKGNEKSHKGK